MDKHQIGIVLVMIALFALCVYMGINAFSDEENFRQDKRYTLPIVPKNKVEKGFTSKLDQIMHKEEEMSRERLSSQNSKEIDLDVFGLVDTDEEIKEVNGETAKMVVKASKKTIIRKEKSRKEISADRPSLKNSLPDPDLEFFATNPTQTPNVPERSEIMIYAVVHDQASVSQGERVTIRTTKEFNLGEIVLPKNTFLHAMARFSNNRVQLSIPSIKFSDGTILQQRLVAYDGNDDNLGLYAPKLLENTATNEIASNMVSEVGSQVPNSLIRDIAGSFGKGKLREKTIPLRRNHPIILRQK